MDTGISVRSMDGYFKSSCRPFGVNSISSQPARCSRVAIMLYRAFIKGGNLGYYRPVWKQHVTFGKAI